MEQKETQVETPAKSEQRWLPFGWKIGTAWTLTLVLMPIFCLLALIGLGLGVYEGLMRVTLPPLVQVVWVMVIVVLIIVVIMHTLMIIFTLKEWFDGWEDVFIGPPHFIYWVVGIGLLATLVGLANTQYGVSSGGLLAILITFTFADIWSLSRMREENKTGE